MTEKRRAGTKAAYAKERGWTKAYLSKADVKERLQSAMFVDTADGKKKLDYDLADKIFEETADPARQKENTKKKPATATAADQTAAADTTDPALENTEKDHRTYTSVKKDLEEIKLKEAQLSFEERAGRTLSKEDVTNALLKAGRILQEKLKSRNRRMAGQLNTISDHLVILSMLNASDREILEGLSNDIVEQLKL